MLIFNKPAAIKCSGFKSVYMKIKTCSIWRYFNTLFILFPLLTFAQNKKLTDQPLRLEGSIQSGFFYNLFYTNIAFSGDAYGADPSSYSTIKGKRAQLGKMDRIEFKYLFNARSAISFNFSKAIWKDLYGKENDPLEVWTETRRDNQRMQLSVNYYRIFPSGKKSQWSLASGFQIQLEKISFPVYSTNDPLNPNLITSVDARSYRASFEDWAIPITIAYHWKINKNLHLGFMMHSAYTAYTGVDGLAIMGSIAIPFGRSIPIGRVRRNNNQP